MNSAKLVLTKFRWAWALLITSAVFAQPVDDDGPPVRPVSPSRPMDPSYQILLTRSIFSKDHNRAAVVNHPAPATTRSSESVIAAPAEANYILRGVTVVDGIPTAFIEQMDEKKLSYVQPGDFIARGQLIAVTLDGIDFSIDGRLSHVQMGQGLSGGVAIVAAPPTTMPATDDHTSWWVRKNHKD